MFKEATKENLKLRMALIGPPGSGKTLSALFIARGLVGDTGKIAVIDTENNSACLYSGKTEIGSFQCAAMNPPYVVDKYLKALGFAAEHFDVVIVDSLSHAWAGEGGILDKKAALDEKNPNANTYTNWKKINPEQNSLISAVLHSKIHTIVTLRTKIEYVLESNEKGKMVPKKMGLAPVQRDGVEYEFDIILDMAQDHSALATKDRTEIFQGEVFKPSVDTGKKLAKWIIGGTKDEAPISNRQ